MCFCWPERLSRERGCQRAACKGEKCHPRVRCVSVEITYWHHVAWTCKISCLFRYERVNVEQRNLFWSGKQFSCYYTSRKQQKANKCTNTRARRTNYRIVRHVLYFSNRTINSHQISDWGRLQDVLLVGSYENWSFRENEHGGTPPSWISNKCCSSLTVWGIVTKLEMKIGFKKYYQWRQWKIEFLRRPTWRTPPSWISEKCCSSLTVWAIFTKFEMKIASKTYY